MKIIYDYSCLYSASFAVGFQCIVLFMCTDLSTRDGFVLDCYSASAAACSCMFVLSSGVNTSLKLVLVPYNNAAECVRQLIIVLLTRLKKNPLIVYCLCF
jgi:hypothetical protein